MVYDSVTKTVVLFDQCKIIMEMSQISLGQTIRDNPYESGTDCPIRVLIFFYLH